MSDLSHNRTVNGLHLRFIDFITAHKRIRFFVNVMFVLLPIMILLLESGIRIDQENRDPLTLLILGLVAVIASFICLSQFATSEILINNRDRLIKIQDIEDELSKLSRQLHSTNDPYAVPVIQRKLREPSNPIYPADTMTWIESANTSIYLLTPSPGRVFNETNRDKLKTWLAEKPERKLRIITYNPDCPSCDAFDKLNTDEHHAGKFSNGLKTVLCNNRNWIESRKDQVDIKLWNLTMNHSLLIIDHEIADESQRKCRVSILSYKIERAERAEIVLNNATHPELYQVFVTEFLNMWNQKEDASLDYTKWSANTTC